MPHGEVDRLLLAVAPGAGMALLPRMCRRALRRRGRPFRPAERRESGLDDVGMCKLTICSSSTATGSPTPPEGRIHSDTERFRGIADAPGFPLFPHSPTASRRCDRAPSAPPTYE